ncbi:MAG: hypothetical protein PHP85_14700 [Gallionella sp.]|nr:hypothetical protein [Gallionella sp.]
MNPIDKIKQAAYAVVMILIGLGSWWITADHYQAKIAKMKTTQAEGVAAAEKAARNSLELAKQRGDTLSEKLAETESALNHKTLEVSREVSRLAVGRRCLDSNLVGVLNQPSTAASGVAAAPSSSPQAADAANFASDQDVGQWIIFANNQYEICSARLNALIDWFGPKTSTGSSK